MTKVANRELDRAIDADVDLCVECSRPIGPDGRWWSDGIGELHPYCAEGSRREFGV